MADREGTEAKALLNSMRANGRITDADVGRWQVAATWLAALETMSDEGANVVVKFDGLRPQARYTVVLSAPPLGDAFFRRDGDDVLDLLEGAVAFYQNEVWAKRGTR